MQFQDLNLMHYIYSLIFIVVVVIGMFIYLLSRNTYKAAVASLLGTLGGFGIGQVIPGFTFISPESPNLVITTEVPSIENITLMIIVGVLIGLITYILHLSESDIRRKG